MMLQSAILAVLIATGPGQTPKSSQVIPRIGVAMYLLDLKFEGFFIGEIRSLKGGSNWTAKNVSVQTKATLKCWPGKKADRGNYQLTIGSRVVTGEWSISEERVHLWIDQIDRANVDSVYELSFRVLRFVDDGWVARIFPSEESSQLKGKLVMSNVPNPKYHMTTSSGRLSPSRTEIVVQRSG
ncbi:MAG: hypothetical protein H7Y17_16800 [Chlorobia bacterium]|nr:hypothetical protein [Fimbriimonadaceae bacterium]